MKLIIAVGTLFFLLVVTLAALPFLVDLNPYVEEYKPQIEDVLGRVIKIQDVRLTIWPRLGARVGGFAIMDDPNFGSKPFASFDSLDIGVKLWPLLRGRVEVEDISLRTPIITVIKNEQGVLNVSSLGSRGPAGPGDIASPPVSSPAEEGPLAALALLAVERVMLTDGQVTYRDLSTAPKPTQYVLEDLEVRLAEVQLGGVPTVYLRTLVQPVNLPVTLDGLVGPLKETSELERVDVTLGLGKTSLTMEGSVQGGRARFTLTSPEINSANLPVQLPLTKPIAAKKLRARVDMPFPMPADVSLLEVVAIQPLELDVAMGDSTVAIRGTVMSRRANFTITSNSLSTHDLPVKVDLAKPVLMKGVNVNLEAPVPLLAGVPVLDQLIVQPVELEAVMGRSTLSVRGRAVGGEVKVNASAPVLHTKDLPITIAALQESIELRNVRMVGDMKDHRARVTNLSMDVLGGDLKGAGGVTLNITPLPFEGTISVNGLQLEPLLGALGVGTVRLSGTSSANLVLRGRGFAQPQLTKDLHGTARMKVVDGTVEGFDLGREAVSVLKAVGISPEEVKATVFSTLEAALSVKQGVATVQTMRLLSHEVQANGRGTIGFDQTLKLNVDVALSPRLSQKLTASSPVARLAMSNDRVTVPLVIGGTIQSPTYGLDTRGVGGKIQDNLQQQIEERVRKEAEQLLKDKSGDAIRKGTDALRQLFGQ